MSECSLGSSPASCHRLFTNSSCAHCAPNIKASFSTEGFLSMSPKTRFAVLSIFFSSIIVLSFSVENAYESHHEGDYHIKLEYQIAHALLTKFKYANLHKS